MRRRKKAMFKSKLQEICQSKQMGIPDYQIKKEGPDHRPRFKAMVVVNGISFTTTTFVSTIKEAKNLAAKQAFEHFSGRSDLRHMPASTSIQSQETFSNDMTHMYKLQLQNYAQKRNLQLPVYFIKTEGPAQATRYKSKVILEGKSYEPNELFDTAKEAEHAAAKIALASVIPEGTEKDNPFIYKNLLQEITQKEGSCLPKYSTDSAGLPHAPKFVSTVEIHGETFKGQEENTKKLAELNVAKVAYLALKERRSKNDDKVMVEGATSRVMKTPISSSKNVKHDAQPVSDKQIQCFKDKGLEATPNPFTRITGATSHVMKTPVSSSDKQIQCVKVKGLEGTPKPFTRISRAATVSGNIQKTTSSIREQATPNPFTMVTRAATISGRNQNLKATSSIPERTSHPKASDNKKMKIKIPVLPQSDESSLEDVKPVIHNQKDLKRPQERITPDPCECTLHSNKKWIALVVPKEET